MERRCVRTWLIFACCNWVCVSFAQTWSIERLVEPIARAAGIGATAEHALVIHMPDTYVDGQLVMVSPE